MMGVVTKINEKLKSLFRQKGQGLVESALILALCVGIGLAAREMGFFDAISAVFDSGEQPEYLTAAIGGGTAGGSNSGNTGGNETGGNTGGNETGGNTGGNETGGNTGGNETGGNTGVNPDGTRTGTGGIGPSGKDWGAIDPKDYYNKEYDDFTKEASQADRLKADQNALVNIAKHFIGMTQEEVKKLMKNGTAADMNKNSEDITLGHFVPVIVDGKYAGMKFETEATKLKLGDGTTINVPSGYLKKSEQENIIAWMQGIYTENNGPTVNGVQKNENYDSSRMYLVSDYVVSQDWADSSGSIQQNGLKIKLEYNYSNNDYGGTVNTSLTKPEDVVVVGVHLCLDPKSQDNDALGTTSSYNSMSSKGLDVQVRTASDGSLYITQVDTAKPNRLVTTTTTNQQTGEVVQKTELKLMEYDINGNLVGSSGNPTYQWYGNGYQNLVDSYIKNNVEHTISNGTVTDTYTEGEIIKIKNSYYIVTKTGEQTINSNNNQTTLEQQALVKITGDPANYWHENATGTDRTYAKATPYNETTQSYTNRKYTIRGVPVTLDTGEIYVYVGQAPWEYTGINGTDFIKIKDSTITPWSFDSTIVP